VDFEFGGCTNVLPIRSSAGPAKEIRDKKREAKVTTPRPKGACTKERLSVSGSKSYSPEKGGLGEKNRWEEGTQRDTARRLGAKKPKKEGGLRTGTKRTWEENYNSGTEKSG